MNTLNMCMMLLCSGTETNSSSWEEIGWELNERWMVVKEKRRSVPDVFDSELRPLKVVFLNNHANIQDAWKSVGSGYSV